MSWQDRIDVCVIKALGKRHESLEELLRTLPNIYPADVIACMDRLRASGTAMPELTFEVGDEERDLRLPRPHPLDYDWRFTKATRDLLHQVMRNGNKQRKILLGAPTLFLDRTDDDDVHLIDSNTTLRSSFPTTENFHCLDLLTDDLPALVGDVVLADPPWYSEHLTAFLIAGAQLLRNLGTLLLSAPGSGTRPTIDEELAALHETAAQAGLKHDVTTNGILHYSIPGFERNALHAAGIDLRGPWRTGDLVRFTKIAESKDTRSRTRQTTWDQYELGQVRLRIRSTTDTHFRDPRLISIVENDVLPTVSRRDEMRRAASVWTSGNRIFRTDGIGTLHKILAALQQRQDPHIQFSDRTKDERALVAAAVIQLAGLVALEETENEKYQA